MNAALETRAVSKSFGAFAANTDVNLTIEVGARHALIGPNGAGKTTLINLLTGVLAPSSGEIILNGEPITHLSQHGRVKLGLARTFQINTLFAALTVLESILIAVCERRGEGGDWWRPMARRGDAVAEAMTWLDMLGLATDARVLTSALPYGKQRLVEIALALATRPRVLLLDEPAAGVPASESSMLFDALARLPSEMTIVFIEHDMDLVFRFAQRITVLVSGRVLMEGRPDEVASDERVREVYLGESAHG